MGRIHFSRIAKEDLRDILRYTKLTWGKTKAERYLSELERFFDLLAKHPYTGRTAEILSPGLRRIEHRRHVIFYSLLDTEVRVERILHDERQFASVDFELDQS